MRYGAKCPTCGEVYLPATMSSPEELCDCPSVEYDGPETRDDAFDATGRDDYERED